MRRLLRKLLRRTPLALAPTLDPEEPRPPGCSCAYGMHQRGLAPYDIRSLRVVTSKKCTVHGPLLRKQRTEKSHEQTNC